MLLQAVKWISLSLVIFIVLIFFFSCFLCVQVSFGNPQNHFNYITLRNRRSLPKMCKLVPEEAKCFNVQVHVSSQTFYCISLCGNSFLKDECFYFLLLFFAFLCVSDLQFLLFLFFPTSVPRIFSISSHNNSQQRGLCYLFFPQVVVHYTLLVI